ncbi:MAG: hypothetical protein N2517_09395 [Ignavibacteria bacterium]|nr:hypothetical protein [Ignavibacteria bacterium]
MDGVEKYETKGIEITNGSEIKLSIKNSKNSQNSKRKNTKIIANFFISPFKVTPAELILIDEVVEKLKVKSRRKAVMKLVFEFLKKDYE